ncbi:uncharacterized protein [Clytia hemisphaerica]|uniref:BTB domain-containing protein n=1 Tax=Clytia hemisphaerica TaxID=252671 RepID=A0A7M5XHZ7_9CNID|eukprot:TCONS_00010024-protein
MSESKENEKIEEQKEPARFTQPWKNSDVVLVAEEKEIHVHSTTLSMVSPVFEAMFNGSFKESKTKKVTLEGKSYDTLMYVMKMIYPFDNIKFEFDSLVCETCETKESNGLIYSTKGSCRRCNAGLSNPRIQHLVRRLQGLYLLANEYMIDVVLDQVKCELTRQSKQIMNMYHAFDLLETAEVTQLEELKTTCLHFSKSYLSSYTLMNQLLTNRKISLETQLRLKGVLLTYILARTSNPGGSYLNEMKQVADDFSTISLEKSHKAVQ